MSKRITKASAGASVAVQAARRKEARGHVPELPMRRLEHGIHPKTGRPTYHAVLPQPGGLEPSRIDISFMLEFPNLLLLFGPAFLAYCAGQKAGTYREAASNLKLGFFKFVRLVYGANLHPEEINDVVLLAYRSHLNLEKGKNGKALAGATIANYLGSLRNVLASLTSGPFAQAARRIAGRVPAGPAGRVKTTVPTEVLSLDELLRVMEAAEREVLAVEARYLRGLELIDFGSRKLAYVEASAGYLDEASFELDTALATLNKLYPGMIPEISTVAEENQALSESMRRLAKEHGGIDLSRYFHPSSRDLVAFVILITITAVFNPDTALWLKWENIDMQKDVAGIPMIEIIGVKDRATDNLVRLLDPNAGVSSLISLYRLLTLLRNYTARIRPFVAKGHEDFIFIFLQETRVKNPKSWGKLGSTFQGPSHDSVWKFSLESFVKQNGLKRFTLSQLRPTVLNLVQTLDGSLEAAVRVGNHGSVRTTWTHYTSDGVRKQYRERIGQILLLRERWFDSEGRVDPRIRTAPADKGAATPGFMCVDPFDSPRPNQVPGRLCNDYGGCPACPLSGAFPQDPDSVAFYTALVDAIFKSQGIMSSKTWLKRWAPVLSDLRALLALVPEDILLRSQQVVVRLPLVG
jgi:hypothetical protein